MQNRILLIIVSILSVVLLIMSSMKNTAFLNGKEFQNIDVLNEDTDEVHNLGLEEYIVGVVAAEMPASFHEEALKAQAVASRSYAVYKINNSNKDYDVVTSVFDQSYITEEEMKEKWQENFAKYYEKISSAVKETEGLVLTYEGEVIEAFYFAMSNGYTENVSLVFGTDLDYLQSVESIYDNDKLNNFEVSTKFTEKEICEKLKLDCENITITNIQRSNTNRVISLYVNDTYFKGTTFRKLLDLRSTDFTIKKENDLVYITTKGYGHGVGMSQYGANGMAQNGATYEEILLYFYKNVEINPI